MKCIIILSFMILPLSAFLWNRWLKDDANVFSDHFPETTQVKRHKRASWGYDKFGLPLKTTKDNKQPWVAMAEKKGPMKGEKIDPGTQDFVPISATSLSQKTKRSAKKPTTKPTSSIDDKASKRNTYIIIGVFAAIFAIFFLRKRQKAEEAKLKKEKEEQLEQAQERKKNKKKKKKKKVGDVQASGGAGMMPAGGPGMPFQGGMAWPNVGMGMPPQWPAVGMSPVGMSPGGGTGMSPGQETGTIPAGQPYQ